MENNSLKWESAIIPEIIEDGNLAQPIVLVDHDKDRLRAYADTELIENVEFADGMTHDIKARAHFDENGEVSWSFMRKLPKLEIPRKIGNNELSDKDFKTLSEGDMAGPFEHEGGQIFFSVDPELNSVKVLDSRQFGIPNKLGDYKLCKEDFLNLAEGKEMDMRVFASDDGKHWFTGKYFIDSETGARGVNDWNEITETEANQLRDKLNTGTPLDGAENTSTSQANELNEMVYDAVVINPENEPDVYSRQDIMNMIDSGCTSQLKELTQGGFVPDLGMEEAINNLPPLNRMDIKQSMNMSQEGTVAGNIFFRDLDKMITGKKKVKDIYHKIIIDQRVKNAIVKADATAQQKYTFLKSLGASDPEAHVVSVVTKIEKEQRILSGKERKKALGLALKGDIQGLVKVTKGSVPDIYLYKLMVKAKVGDELVVAAGANVKALAEIKSQASQKTGQVGRDFNKASVQEKSNKLGLNKNVANNVLKEFRRLGSDM